MTEQFSLFDQQPIEETEETDVTEEVEEPAPAPVDVSDLAEDVVVTPKKETPLDRAIRHRDAGMARVSENVSDEWAKAIEQVIADIAHRLPQFTMDTINQEMREKHPGLVPHHPNAIGAAIGAYAKKYRTIENTGQTVISQREEAHARRIAIWRSRAPGVR